MSEFNIGDQVRIPDDLSGPGGTGPGTSLYREFEGKIGTVLAVDEYDGEVDGYQVQVEGVFDPVLNDDVIYLFVGEGEKVTDAEAG